MSANATTTHAHRLQKDDNIIKEIIEPEGM